MSVYISILGFFSLFKPKTDALYVRKSIKQFFVILISLIKNIFY